MGGLIDGKEHEGAGKVCWMEATSDSWRSLLDQAKARPGLECFEAV